MTKIDEKTAREIHAKVNEALTGISIPHAQQAKIDKVFDDLVNVDDTKASKSSGASTKVSASAHS